MGGVRPGGGLVLRAVDGEEIGQGGVGDLELGVEALGGEQALGLTVVVGVELAIRELLGGGSPAGGGDQRPDLGEVSPAQGGQLGGGGVNRGIEGLESLKGGWSEGVGGGIQRGEAIQRGEQVSGRGGRCDRLGVSRSGEEGRLSGAGAEQVSGSQEAHPGMGFEPAEGSPGGGRIAPGAGGQVAAQPEEGGLGGMTGEGSGEG